MDARDLIALLPLLAIAAGSLVVLLLAAFRPGHRAAAVGTAATLALACLLALQASGEIPRQAPRILVVDRYALFYIVLFALSGIVVAALSYGYLERRSGERREEYYVLLLLAVLGSCALAASAHFASFFLGVEILSVSLYVLVSYPSDSRISLEAGFKYLLLAGASSAFLLFGMAILYYRFGTMEFSRLGEAVAAAGALREAPLLFGVGMILTGVGFKLGVVPFHMWTPDVFEGAPAPVTAFVATVSKGAVFALLLRFLVESRIHALPSVLAALAAVAVASMLAGNLLALLQDNVKRILAYSSISHLGYLLTALLAGEAPAGEPVTFYIAAYFVTMLGALGIVAAVSAGKRDAFAIGDYRGLFWSRPWTAVAFSAFLFSLAGIPLTGGFIGKFYVLAAAVRVEIWLPAVVLVVSSTIGLYYYLRIIAALYSRAPETGERAVAAAPALFSAGGAVLAILAALLVWLGVYPVPFIRLIRDALQGLAGGM